MDQTLKDRDLGELAVRHNFISQEELEAALEAQKISDPPRSITEILLEMQLITQTQLDRIVRLRERPTEQRSAINDLFGRLAVQLEFASQEQVEECLAEQRLMESQGQRMRLGQIMLKRRFLTTEQFLEILRLQEKTVLTCPSCQARYLVGELGEPESGGVFRCLTCQAILNLPSGETAGEATTRAETPSLPPAAPPPRERGPESGVETIRLPGPQTLHPSDSAAITKSSMPPPKAADGKTFGRYEILETVGRGPLAVVHRARDLQRQRTVALKVLQGSPPDPQVAQRFLREARLAAQLDHPGIIEIHEVGSSEEVPYFSMEYIDGRSLERMLEERRASRDEIVSILEKACRALEYAHSQGVAHRNLRPSNILIDQAKTPRLSDFGFRTDVAPTTAPEQVRGQEECVDARTDIYALGAILYQVLAGKPPFEGAPEEMSRAILKGAPPRPREFSPDIPRELEVICLKAMDRDRALRYGGAGEMADDLRRYLEGEPITARPISVVTRFGSRVRRHLGLSIALPVIAVLVVGGGVFGVDWVRKYRRQQERRQNEERRAKAKKPYDEAAAALEDVVRGGNQDRESLRDLRRTSEEIANRLDEAARLLGKDNAKAAALLREARDRFAAVAKSLAAATAEREAAQKGLDEGKDKFTQAGKTWQRPAAESDRLLRECEDKHREAVRAWNRIKAWPAEDRRSLERAVAKLDEAIAADPHHPESLQLRARAQLLLGRYEAAGRDFAAAKDAFARTIAWKEEDPASAPDLERLRQMQTALRLEFGKYLFLVYELWRGRPFVLFGERGESLVFSAAETGPAEKARRDMAAEFRDFLKAQKGEPQETMLAQAALFVAGEPPQGFKLSEADLYLRGDKSDGVPLRVLALAHQQANAKERSVRKPYEYSHNATQFGGSLLDRSVPGYGLAVHPRAALEWAVELHTQALAKAPAAELHVNRGVLHFALREFEKAAKDFEAALQMRPGDTEAMLRKAALLLSAGNVEGASPLVKQVLGAGSPSAETLALRSAILLAQGDPEEALVEVEKALKLQPEDPTLLYLLGRIHLARGDPSQAMINATRAAESLPSFHQAHELRAAAKVDIQDFLGAREDVREALRLRPDYAPAHVTMARVRHRSADLVSADLDLDHAAALDPKSPLPWIWRGEFLRLTVFTKSRELLRRQARDAQARERMGQVLTQAHDAYAKAAALDPSCADAHVMAVLCKIETSRPQAVEELEELVRRFPKFAFALEVRGWVHYAGQRFESAMNDWKRAGELQPARRAHYKDLHDDAKHRYEEERARPEWYKRWNRAQEFVRQYKYDQAYAEYRAAEPHLPQELPTTQEELQLLIVGSYNYACVLAVAARSNESRRADLVEEAFKWLAVSLDLGFRYSRDGGRCHVTGGEHARADEDLTILRDDPRFARLLGYSED